MLVAHGGNHNDTIITVERKINTKVSNFTQGATPSFNKDYLNIYYVIEERKPIKEDDTKCKKH